MPFRVISGRWSVDGIEDAGVAGPFEVIRKRAGRGRAFDAGLGVLPGAVDSIAAKCR